MDKNQPRGTKNLKKTRFSLLTNDLFCRNSVLLRGSSSAVLYGCGRILFLGRERICFSMGERSVSVFGKALCCTVFSPVGVTVEGDIAGVCYCSGVCVGSCQKTLQEEGEA